MTPPTNSVFPAVLRSRYEPVATLGQGGMGRVFKVRDLQLNRVAALKMLLQASDARHRKRFLREAQISSQIRHPNIVEVYDFGLVEGLPYLVMEYVPGRSLDQVRPVPDALGILMTVARALEALHDQKIIHRDVKPANVLLGEDGRAVLTDFGLARAPDQKRLTATGSVVGTLAYMAPEQIRNDPITPAADWWAWAVMLYELTEGRRPFEQSQVIALACNLEASVPPLEFSDPEAPSARLVRACLVRDPEARPQSLAALTDLLNNPRVEAPTPSRATVVHAAIPEVPDTEAPAPLRHRWIAGFAAGLLALALYPRPPPPPTPPAPSPPVAPSRLALAAGDLAAELAAVPALSDPDPRVSTKAWSLPATTRLLAEMAMVADIPSLPPEDLDALEDLEEVASRAGSPPMLEPLLSLRRLETAAPRPAMVANEPRWSIDLPATATGYLGAAYEAFPRYLRATIQLREDVQAFLRNEPVPESFPFLSDRAEPTFLRNKLMFEAKLANDLSVRAKARAWFRPSIRAARRLYAAIGACLRHEPEHRHAAFVLGSVETIRTKYLWLSYLSVIDPDLLLGGPAATPAYHILRALILDRQWTVYRVGAGRSGSFASAIRSAATDGLSEVPTNPEGDRQLRFGLELLLRLGIREGSVHTLRPMLARYLHRAVKMTDPWAAGNVIRAVMEAEELGQPGDLLTPPQAAAIRRYVQSNAPPWGEEVSLEVDARWRARLAEITR